MWPFPSPTAIIDTGWGSLVRELQHHGICHGPGIQVFPGAGPRWCRWCHGILVVNALGNWVKQSSVYPDSAPVSHKSFDAVMLVTSLRMNFFWTEKLDHKFKTQSCYLQWMPLPLLHEDRLCLAKHLQTDSKLSHLEFHTLNTFLLDTKSVVIWLTLWAATG